MNTLTKSSAAALVITAGLAAPASARPDLLVTGGTVNFNGTFQDFSVPDVVGSIFRFSVSGGDGGDAVVGNNGNCFNAGGQGATAILDVAIGDTGSPVVPGRLIRFVVGQRGADNIISGPIFTATSAAAGGGGGSAVLLDNAPRFDLLVAAGGGGGAYSGGSFGVCTAPNQDGNNGEAGECGGRGNDPFGSDGGCGGLAGVTTTDIAGGGAGFNQTSGSASGLGGRVGVDTGGSGGIGIANGGYGIGGGGAGFVGGGGGGGYSGGGAGGALAAGGGGGSFTASQFARGTDTVIRDSPGVRDGQITYAIVGQIHDSRDNPIALSADQTLIRGMTQGATFDPNESCGPAVNDVWYAYTNDTADFQVFTVESDGLVSNLGLTSNDNCLFSNPTIISFLVGPGETIKISVGVNSPLSFALPMSVTIPDSDGDGVSDSLDVCPGVDDTTLTPQQLAADVDRDGIIDLCDRLCAADFFPDGMFDFNDVANYDLVAVLSFGNDASLDLDGSGVNDFFDWAVLQNGCE